MPDVILYIPVNEPLTKTIYRLYWDNCPFFYFGMCGWVEDRMCSHLYMLKYGKHSSDKLQNAYDNYGIPKYEVIIYCNSKDARKTEAALIAHHSNDPNCCNVKGNKVEVAKRLKVKKEREDHLAKIMGAVPKKPRKPNGRYSETVDINPLAQSSQQNIIHP